MRRTVYGAEVVLSQDGNRPVLLVLRALGIGDLLTAVPALRALAEAFPHHRRVLVTPAKLATLAIATGAIDAVVPPERVARWRRNRLAPEIAVNLHSISPASYGLLLDTDPSRLIGFHAPDVAETAGFPVIRPGEHEVTRWCRLLTENGIPADPTRLDLAVPAPRPQCRANGATLLHPGSSDPVRRWPLDRWAAVATAEVDEGRRCVLTGSAEEEEGARSIAAAAQMDHDHTWLGGTDVVRMASIVSVAARVVSVDTGVAHLATALRRPSVILFGAKHPPSRWGPPQDRPWHRVLWHDSPLEVSGIDTITVEEVLTSIRGLEEDNHLPFAGAGE